MASASLVAEEDDATGWDPMKEDFQDNLNSLNGEDCGPGVVGRTHLSDFVKDDDGNGNKETPCPHHDGVSGRCWKGRRCRYSHKIFTGGRFTRANPELSAAISATREATTVNSLPPKPNLTKGSYFPCEMVHIQSPSEFFIRIKQANPTCVCHWVDEQIEKAKRGGGEGPSNFDSYLYGFGCMEPPKGMESQEELNPETKSVTQKLTRFMTLHPRLSQKLRSNFYIPDVELVAVRTDSAWMRGIVLKTLDFTPEDAGKLTVQLLDTGETVKIEKPKVCRLPERFCEYRAEAYKCCLHGVYPKEFVLGLDAEATKSFQELTVSAELYVCVKDAVQGEVQTFEQPPYGVQVLVNSGDGLINVGEKLIAAGLACDWNDSSRKEEDKYDTDSDDDIGSSMTEVMERLGLKNGHD